MQLKNFTAHRVKKTELTYSMLLMTNFGYGNTQVTGTTFVMQFLFLNELYVHNSKSYNLRMSVLGGIQ